MKTKLLKIVRKRYEIVKITEFEKQPYFVITDKDIEWFNYGTQKNLKEAITLLIESVKIDYKDVSKRRKTKKEKQWWVK